MVERVIVSDNPNGQVINEWSGFYPVLHALTRTARGFIICLLRAEVVEWQTRTFEGRVGKPMRVQVPPSAPNNHPDCIHFSYFKSLLCLKWDKRGLEPGVLKGVFPLHGVTGMKRRHEELAPLWEQEGFCQATSNQIFGTNPFLPIT